jgi:hypothetical protein
MIDELPGDVAIVEYLLRAVDVGDEPIEGSKSLHETRLDSVPFAPTNDSGNDVERPCPIDSIAFGVDREGDARRLDTEVCGMLSFFNLLDTKTLKVTDQCCCSIAWLASLVDEFIEGRGLVVAEEHLSFL